MAQNIPRPEYNLRGRALNKNRKLIYGVAINDADYKVSVTYKGKCVWTCPIYQTWRGILERCYDKRRHAKFPTYKDCTIYEEWLYFMNFHKWMTQEDWEGKHLDKDLLSMSNKYYSPENCVFVSEAVNGFMTKSDATRGTLPLGVHQRKEYRIPTYKAQGRCVLKRKTKCLGTFKDITEAHKAWQLHRINMAEHLKQLPENSDPRVQQGLQRVIDKIQNDYDNDRETVTF